MTLRPLQLPNRNHGGLEANCVAAYDSVAEAHYPLRVGVQETAEAYARVRLARSDCSRGRINSANGFRGFTWPWPLAFFRGLSLGRSGVWSPTPTDESS